MLVAKQKIAHLWHAAASLVCAHSASCQFPPLFLSALVLLLAAAPVPSAAFTLSLPLNCFSYDRHDMPVHTI